MSYVPSQPFYRTVPAARKPVAPVMYPWILKYYVRGALVVVKIKAAADSHKAREEAVKLHPFLRAVHPEYFRATSLSRRRAHPTAR